MRKNAKRKGKRGGKREREGVEKHTRPFLLFLFPFSLLSFPFFLLLFASA
jgi:hypothetical protein